MTTTGNIGEDAVAAEKEFMKRLLAFVEENSGSKKKVAQRLCVTETTLSNWLSGRRNPMSESLVNAIDSMGLVLAPQEGCKREDVPVPIQDDNGGATPRRVTIAVTSVEREQLAEIERLKEALARKEVEIVEAKTTARILKEQVNMLFKLLSGGRGSFTATNNGDGVLNQTNQ